MGKRLIQQARGKGGPRYRSPGFNFKGRAGFPDMKSEGLVIDLVKCPGHTAPLSLVEYEDNSVGYMIAPEGLKVGQIISLSVSSEVFTGNIMELSKIPSGAIVHNIEGIPGDGGKFIRASGAFGRVLNHTEEGTVIELPSKKTKMFNNNCRAAIGVAAGGGRLEKPMLKAGKKHHAMAARNKLYPKVSGVAMNSVDHPFGGSKSGHKGRPQNAPKNAPPGRKVGKIRARRTGKKR